MIASIRPSTFVSIFSASTGCNPSNLRKKLPTDVKNFCRVVTFSLPTRIPPNCCLNSGLVNASATNSSRDFEPYSSGKASFTSSYSFCNCLVSGCDLFASVAEVTAWVVSCSIVCTLPAWRLSSLIVLVAGSKKPATGSPISLRRSLSTTTFVVPT